ncbi:MAG TPA: ATP-binding protein [Candidatus Binatia bacterium]|nr:ATP-binding protein [Candidatus Binatia bacterium]
MAWGLGLFGVAFALNTIGGAIYTRRQIGQSTAALQTEIAGLTARHIQTFIARKIERLDDLASSMALHPLGADEQKTLAHLLVKKDSAFTEIALLNDDGRELFKISDRRVILPADLEDLSDTPAFRSIMEGQTYTSPVYTSDRAEPYFFLAVPLKATPRRSAGGLIARTNLKFLWEVVSEKKFSRAGYVYLVNETGDLIAHQDSSLVLKHLSLTSLPKVAKFLRTRAPDQAAAERGIGLNGAEVLSTYALVTDLGWAVMVEEPVDFALADIRKLEWLTEIILTVGLVLGTILIVFLSNRITRPILQLRQSAEIIGNGDLSHRVNVRSNDEIAELGAQFNQMAEALKSSRDTLEKKVELRTQEISALYDVTTTVNQSLAIETVLNDVIKKVTARFGFDTTRIFLFDSQSEILTLRASYNAAQAPNVGVGPFRKGQSIVGRVAESGEAALFEDLQADSRYAAWSESKASHAAGFHFLAVLPIKTKTRIFGAIACSGSEPRRLSAQEVRLLNSMCEHVAVAIDKANLFDEVNKRSEELERKNRELERALRVKSEFVAGMSHELRTPLNVIMGYAKMTEEGILGEVNPEQKDAQQKISRHAEVLLKMVNDVLSLSRAEAQELSLNIGKVYVEELIAQLKGQIELLNRNKNLEFGWHYENDIPPLATDALKLEEILQNLVGNAMKFTPVGSVRIHVRNLAQQERVEFSVADTGIGIEEAELEKIFNAFEQGKDAHTGNLEGVGLGLSIVKKYLQLMHGEIRVTSRVGKGSTFTFTIPHHLDEPAKAAA